MLGFKFLESLLLFLFLALILVFSVAAKGQAASDTEKNDSSKEEVEVLVGQRDPFDIVKIYRSADGRERVEVNIAKFLSRANAAHRFVQQVTAMAAEKSSSRRIKSYADRVSRDYRMIQERLEKLARKKGIPIDKVHMHSDQDQRSDLIRQWWKELLSERRGREFEEPYLRWAFQWNRRSLRSHQGISGFLADTDIREFVNDVAPIIRQHLALVKVLRREGRYAR